MPRKKRQEKKKGKPKKNRSLIPRAIRTMSANVPRRMKLVFKNSEVYKNSALVANGRVLLRDSLNAPMSSLSGFTAMTGANSQFQNYDQWSTFYQTTKVLKTYYKITIINLSSSDCLNCYVVNDLQATDYSSPAAYIPAQMLGAQSALLSPSTGSKSSKTFYTSVDPKVHYSVTDLDSEDFIALFNANQAKVVYTHIGCSVPDGSSDMLATVKVDTICIAEVYHTDPIGDS